MKAMRQLGSLIVRMAVMLSLVFGITTRSDAQEKISAQKPPAATPKAVADEQNSQAAERPSGGPQEGIKVHGHWTIVIRNEDGSVASRHEFENALNNFAVLPQILAHGGGVGQWHVAIDGNGAHPCYGNDPANLGGLPVPIPCPLTESTGPNPFFSLSVTPSATALTIRGIAHTDFAVQIGTVSTSFDLCAPPQAPSSSCLNPNGPTSFTSKDITSLNIRVAANQTIDVTVVISFS